MKKSKKRKKVKNTSIRLFEDHDQKIKDHMKNTGATFSGTIAHFLDKLFKSKNSNKNNK